MFYLTYLFALSYAKREIHFKTALYCWKDNLKLCCNIIIQFIFYFLEI